MKLGKIRKLLGVILAVGLVSGNVFAGEVVSSDEVVVSEESSSDTVEGSISMVVEANGFSGDERVDYLLTYGQAVGQSVEKDNVRVTIERILADAYTWQMLISVETIDGTAFKGDGERVWVQGLNVTDKQRLAIEAEKEKLMAALPKDAGLMDYLKIEAQFNETFKSALEKCTKEDGTLDMDEFRAYINDNDGNGWGSASSSYGPGYSGQDTESKKYFVYEGSSQEAMSNEWVLRIDGVRQEKEVTYDITKTVAAYLEAHKNDEVETEPLEITDEEKERLEDLKLTDKEWYEERKAEFENRPKHILAEGNLELAIIPEDEAYWIDNIGFIDNQFHILFKGESQQHYNLELSSKDEEWVMDIYNHESVKYEEEEKEKVVAYRAYDIKDVEALKNYTLTLSTNKLLEETTGLSDIELKLEAFSEPKVITVNQKLAYYDDKEVTLQEVVLNEHSMLLTFTGVEKSMKVARDIQVKLKDGTCKKLYSSAGHGNEVQETSIYALGNLKQEEIVSILWEDKEISLQ